MKHLIWILLFIAFRSNAQSTKIAILDFENVSGNLKYTGLGKAMSSMLISDIEANTSKQKIQLIERGQIQKILKEQNFQSSKLVDKASTVKTGKVLGVKYLLIGEIFILNDQLVINARLANTESGEITFSKKQEGKLTDWLRLKTNIAVQLSKNLSLPFKNPTMIDNEVNESTIVKFGNAIVAKDNGDIVQANELIATIQSSAPGFNYLNDLKNQVDQLSKKVEKVEKNVENLISQVQSIDSRIAEIESKINSKTKIATPNSLEDYLVNSILAYNENDYKTSEIMLEKVFREGYIKYDLVYKYYDVLFNNYDGENDLIKKKLSQSILINNPLLLLAELDYNYSGIEFYIKLAKIKLESPLLKAYLENKKAKSFYSDVQKFGKGMTTIMAHWSPIFSQNELLLGKKIIKTKYMFFDYKIAQKSYLEGSSFTSDENYIWHFYSEKYFKIFVKREDGGLSEYLYLKNPDSVKSAIKFWQKIISQTIK